MGASLLKHNPLTFAAVDLAESASSLWLKSLKFSFGGVGAENKCLMQDIKPLMGENQQSMINFIGKY